MRYPMISALFVATLSVLIITVPADAQLAPPEIDKQFQSYFSSEQAINITVEGKNGAIIQSCKLPCAVSRRGHSALTFIFRGDGLRAVAIPMKIRRGNIFPEYYSVTLPQKDELADNAVFDLPILRTPPKMPQMANKSGFCHMTFSVNSAGQPEKIKATDCAHAMFKKPSIAALKRWRYLPNLENGQAVGRAGLSTKMTFILYDENGMIMSFYGGHGRPQP